VTGLRRFEDAPASKPGGIGGENWPTFIRHWGKIELDFQEVYGIDLGAPDLMRSRSWRWLSLRVIGLLSVDRGPFGTGGSRLQRALRPVKIETPQKGAKP